MATDHRKVDAQLVQEVLLDDPGFLRELVERAVQQILEAEMTEHVGAAPYERVEGRTGQRNGYKPRALRTRVGTHPTRGPTSCATRRFPLKQGNDGEEKAGMM